ncbi:putative nuclease HARBI1 [Portunus trituberculatus]|uniref:putative nuclease HARBI1 n=1 Tax=Portunus trituberculatus TaxID=210409 RepID=UPI001E1D0345|nr:putative nuclease HARBI1 [Portunus trituberculatus]
MAAREELHRHHLRQRRAFRERKDVLNELDDRELVKRYRLDRAGITFVTDLVRERLKRPTVRNEALSPEMQVIITLRYLATGKMQQCSADDLGTSQQTISRVIIDTLEALSDNAILSQFIRFPVTQLETQRRKEEFLQIAGFPEVIGAIDGTHVRIVAPICV